MTNETPEAPSGAPSPEVYLKAATAVQIVEAVLRNLVQSIEDPRDRACVCESVAAASAGGAATFHQIAGDDVETAFTKAAEAVELGLNGLLFNVQAEEVGAVVADTPSGAGHG